MSNNSLIHQKEINVMLVNFSAELNKIYLSNLEHYE
jgi:hypothetical protein